MIGWEVVVKMLTRPNNSQSADWHDHHNSRLASLEHRIKTLSETSACNMLQVRSSCSLSQNCYRTVDEACCSSRSMAEFIWSWHLHASMDRMTVLTAYKTEMQLAVPYHFLIYSNCEISRIKWSKNRPQQSLKDSFGLAAYQPTTHLSSMQETCHVSAVLCYY